MPFIPHRELQNNESPPKNPEIACIFCSTKQLIFWGVISTLYGTVNVTIRKYNCPRKNKPSYGYLDRKIKLWLLEDEEEKKNTT